MPSSLVFHAIYLQIEWQMVKYSTRPWTRRYAMQHTRTLATAYEKYWLEVLQFMDLFYNSVHKEHRKIRRKCSFFCSTSRQSMEGGLLDRSKTALSFPLSALSSLGLHDQSLFLLTELQTAWNQDEIGLQTEVNLSLSPFASLFLPLTFPPSDT